MFDKKAISQALGFVKFIKNLDNVKIEYGKTRLNYGKGEQYGRTPVEFSSIRTCENARDFTGGMNNFVYCIEDMRDFLTRHGVEKENTYGGNL